MGYILGYISFANENLRLQLSSSSDVDTSTFELFNVHYTRTLEL